MTTISIAYQGDFHCEATHGPSGDRLQTDLPADNGGRGEAFSPTDLVATALGTCMMTIMAKVAERNDVDLRAATVRVEKTMAADPRRIARLATVIELPQTLTERDRKSLERAALTCPVHRTLGETVELPVDFRYVR